MAIGMGHKKYANQYADSVKEASKVFNSQVFINWRIIVGSKLLLIAHRKNRQNTRMRGMFFFIVCSVWFLVSATKLVIIPLKSQQMPHYRSANLCVFFIFASKRKKESDAEEQ